ncbi:MAG: V-type ATP synthase subunit I [Methanosarcinales archaeon]|nr:V-type ATP synthase subunit I [Methanosarcinales archaeon]
MSYPKRMSKVLIAGHKKHLEAAVDALYEADLLHVEDFVEGDDSDFEIGMPIKYGEEVSRKLVKVRSIASTLSVRSTDETVPLTESDVSKQLDATLEEMDTEIGRNAEELSRLDARVKDIESAEKELVPFLGYDIGLEYYGGYGNLAVFSGTVSSLNESRLLEITDAYQLFTDSGSKFFVLFVSKRFEKDIQSVLADMGYKEMRAPDKSGRPSDIYAGLEAEKSEIQAQIESLIAKRAALNEKYGNFILASDEYLSILSEKAELPLRIATSEHTFVIEGWVPTNNFDEFTEAVSNKTNNGVHITTLKVDMHDEKEIAKIPVAYENSKFVSPMEAVVDLYSRPKYNEIDPSSVLAISFPLIYGMILGDIGYALVLMTLAFLVMKFMKSDAVKQLMYVLIYCQIFALFFGIIYGEFMGFPLAGLLSHGEYIPGLIPGLETIVFDFGIVPGESFMLPIHRTHMIMTFLVATAAFGFLHLNAGFILGFFDLKGQHGIKHAVLEKLSWIVLEIGAIAAIAAWYLGIGVAGIAVGAIIAVIGVGMLAKGEGIKGPIEIPGLLGNMLSYTRIIAVGLSSIYIASTVNDIAFGGLIWTPADGFSVLMFVSILIFILGHSLNTVLSIIAPGLHALRLQYVEFFGKFYASGGKAYKPFGHLKKYILEE